MRGRKADATVAARLGAEGTGASVVGFIAVVVAAGALTLPVGAAAAPLANFGSFGTPNGSQGGQLSSVSVGVAVNRSGVGAAVGSVYVAESFPNHRISQFSGEGEFVRTWGFDVVDGVNHPGAANDNGTGFEVCDVTAGNTADQCKAGVAGSAAGQLWNPIGAAVDQSNGYLYVTSTHRRVDVFSGTGEFAGAFGYDVRPGDPNPSGPDFCTTATGCQAAADGGGEAGRFQHGATSHPAVDPNVPGRIYLPDGNLRVAHYETTVSGGVLTDVSFVKAFGSDVVASGPGNRTVDRNEQQRVSLFALHPCFCGPAPITGGTFTLSFDPDGGGALPAETTGPIAYDATAGAVQQRLVDDLASIAPGDVSVSGGPGPDAPWTVDFAGAYAGEDVADLVGDGSNLVHGGIGAEVTVETTVQGGQFPAGYEVCVPGDGDVCQTGSSGNGAGEFTSGSPTAVAVDSTGAIYATSGPLGGGTCSAETPCRIQKFSPDVSTATDFGPSSGSGQLTFTSGEASNAVAALNLAVDPANDHVFVLRKEGTDSYRVLEYDSAGNHLDTHPAGPALPANGVTVYTGIAVGLTGRVYVNHGNPNQDPAAGGRGAFILGPVDPPTVTIASPTDVGATTATFHGTVEIPPPGSPTFDTTYRFEYSKNGVDWTAIPSPDANVGDGSTGTHTVTETVTGLDPNTLYSVRLVATTGPTATSNAVSFTTDAAPPRVALSFVDEVTRFGARLGAHIDPEGLDASYHFEWGNRPCSQVPNPCTRVPGFERQLGGGNSVVMAYESIGGLEQATTYHHRVVASSSSGETVGPDQTFETLNDCGLTQGRCYELVSPADKGSMGAAGDLSALGQEIAFQVAPSGDALQYVIAYGAEDATSGEEVSYLAQRGGGGWASKQLTPPTLVSDESSRGSGAVQHHNMWMSADLSCGFFSSTQPLTEDAKATLEAGGEHLFRRNADDNWTLVTSLMPLNSPPMNQFSEFSVIGASEAGAVNECERVVFVTRYVYPGTGGAGVYRLYKWDNGTLFNVGEIPGPGGPEPASVVPGADPEDNDVAAGETYNAWNAVSDDGSRVFFTANSLVGGDTGKAAVFLRDGTAPAVDVSQSQAASLPGGAPNDDNSAYETAATDGARVIFRARYGLASNAAGGAVQSSTGSTSCALLTGVGCDLYSYDVATGKLSDLSATADPANSSGASVSGVLGASDDATRVYFAAIGRLVAGKGNSQAENLAQGTRNVYLSDHGTLSYVGQIDATDGERMYLVWSFRPDAGVNARVTPDGGHLLFETARSNAELDQNAANDVYVYDAGSGSVECVSCRRDLAGTVDSGESRLVGAGLPGTNLAHPPLTISDDGSRVFFISRDRLAFGATEGQRNIYEWHEGQISFVSGSTQGGTNVRKPRLAGASASGDDVFFATTHRMSWQDRDDRMDVYTARVGGGIDQPPPSGEVPCDALAEGSCQGPGSAGSPSSVQTDSTEPGNAPRVARARVSGGRLSARQRRALLAGRTVRLAVRVNRAGTVSVAGVARIAKFRVQVLRGSQRAEKAGRVRIPVRLSRAALSRVAQRHALRVALTVRFADVRKPLVRRYTLKKKPSSRRRLGSDRRATR